MAHETEREVLVVGDETLLRIATACGAPEEAPPRFARSIAEALNLQEAAAGRPVLFVVPRRLLTVVAIGALTHGVRSPWGIITGRDQGAIAFSLIKQQAARRVLSGAALFVDFVADLMGPVTSQGKLVDLSPPSAMSAPELLGSLAQPTGSFFLVHCHGDGAHGNLGNVVLCGLCDEQEHLADGRPACCSRTRGGDFVCKRNPDRARQPVRCGDLGAVTVCLLTCNGSSVAGQGYPSDCSFILSFVEGFPAAVLTSDRRLPFAPSDVELAAALLSARRPLGEVARTLNDERAATSGVRPYVLFGDPTLIPAQPASDLREQAAARPTRKLGATGSVVAPTAMGTLCADLYRIVCTLSGRLRLQDAILSACALLGGPTAAKLHAALDAHARTLRVLRGHLGLGHELSAIPARTTNQDLATWLEALAAVISVVDRSLIDLVHDHISQPDLDQLLTTGLVGSREPSDLVCSRCCVPLLVERYTSPLIAPECTVVAACSHCGPVTAWDRDGPVIAASVPRVACAGSTLTVSVALCRRPLLPPPHAAIPLASVRFRDVGKSSDGGVEGCGIGPVPWVATVKLRPDTTLENNTVRVAAVHELSFGFQRTGVVVLPP